MGTYRLTEDAKSDLKRIYARGLREYGEEQADICQLASNSIQPLAPKAVQSTVWV
jgi:hypothetical protein